MAWLKQIKIGEAKAKSQKKRLANFHEKRQQSCRELKIAIAKHPI
jgi:hypothetical protein